MINNGGLLGTMPQAGHKRMTTTQKYGGIPAVRATQPEAVDTCFQQSKKNTTHRIIASTYNYSSVLTLFFNSFPTLKNGFLRGGTATCAPDLGFLPSLAG